VHENLQIRNKMEQALDVNKSQQQILKELLIKMFTGGGSSQQNISASNVEADLRLKKQQLEQLELLQVNNELLAELETVNANLQRHSEDVLYLQHELSQER
jgi:hypothetical protein